MRGQIVEKVTLFFKIAKASAVIARKHSWKLVATPS
jgi:hypothetical protein